MTIPAGNEVAKELEQLIHHLRVAHRAQSALAITPLGELGQLHDRLHRLDQPDG